MGLKQHEGELFLKNN